MKHLNKEELEAGLNNIFDSPKNNGIVKMIVRRPEVAQREVLTTATLDIKEGLIGDNWLRRGSSKTTDGNAHPEMQLNIMNARAISLIAASKDRWPLAGDQLFLDFDLSYENLPPGTQLQIGSAIIEVTAIPHLGCKKFMQRFGKEAMKFVNSTDGKQHNLRGINAKVIQSGTVNANDSVKKLP